MPGHEGDGNPDGGPFKDGQEFRAKCGMYSYFAEGYPDRCTVGSFHNPTPEFIAVLPKDPAALLAKLKEEGHADDAGAFMQVLEALRSGQYPAEDLSGDKGSLKKGTVRQSSSVTSVIVGALGARP